MLPHCCLSRTDVDGRGASDRGRQRISSSLRPHEQQYRCANGAMWYRNNIRCKMVESASQSSYSG